MSNLFIAKSEKGNNNRQTNCLTDFSEGEAWYFIFQRELQSAPEN